MNEPTETFADFLNNDNDLIKTAATILNEAQQSLQQGELTVDEFNEITDDTLYLNNIEKIADDIEEQIKIKQALNTLQSIALVVTKII